MLTINTKWANLKFSLFARLHMLISQHKMGQLTIPFISAHLVRSRTRLRTSQRAEKFTTAHLSILHGSTSLCKTNTC